MKKATSSVIKYATIGIWLVYQISTSTLLFSEYPQLKNLTGNYSLLLFVAVVTLAVEAHDARKRGYGKTDYMALSILLAMLLPLLHADHYMYASAAILIFTARSLDPKTLVAFCAAITSICFAATLAACALHALPDIQGLRGTTARHYLGFRYCLFPSMYLFSITCMWCFVREKGMTWIEIATLLAANAVLFRFTDARISFATSVLLLAATACYKLLSRKLDWAGAARLMSWCFVATFVLSLAIVGVYALQIRQGASWLTDLNALSGGRINLAYNGLKEIGTTLLGQKVHWVAASVNSSGTRTQGAYNYVDNMYLYSLITLGWIYTIGMIALLTKTARKAALAGEIVLVLAFAAIAIHSVIDDTTMRLYFNPLLFSTGPMLLGWKRKCRDAASAPRSASDE